jgi:hypothetical protein
MYRYQPNTPASAVVELAGARECLIQARKGCSHSLDHFAITLATSLAQSRVVPWDLDCTRWLLFARFFLGACFLNGLGTALWGTDGAVLTAFRNLSNASVPSIKSAVPVFMRVHHCTVPIVRLTKHLFVPCSAQNALRELVPKAALPVLSCDASLHS